MAISHWSNWHLVVKSGQGQWQFYIHYRHLVVKHGNSTLHWHLSRMAISHCYQHLVVKNGIFYIATVEQWQFHIASDIVKKGNFTLLLTSSGQQWQFHIATDICTTMEISHYYWSKNGNFTLLLISSYKHLVVNLMAISHLYWHLVVKNGNFTFDYWISIYIATDI